MKVGLGTQKTDQLWIQMGFPSRKRLLQEAKKSLRNVVGKEDRTGQVFKETERKNKRLQSTSSQKKKKRGR